VANYIRKVKPLNDRYQQIDKESDSAEILKNEITQLNKQMNDYKENLVEENPQTFIASFFRLMTESKIPDTMPTLPDGSKDSSYPYRYYKKHFWDGIDLGDDRLIRTPVFFKKLDTYFDQVVSKNPDSIVYEIDHLLSQMDENGEMFKFSLWHLTVKFDESQIMGHDAILVHMADNYFALGKAYWMDKQVVQNVLDEAEKRRLSLIGKTAPNLIMQDTNFAPRSLHDIKNNYTVLYFWDPECGHCKKETPKLVEFYETDASEMDVEIFAVCADTNMAKMKSYIKEKHMSFINVNGPRSYTQDYHDLYNVFSTPIIIVLDNEKKNYCQKIGKRPTKAIYFGSR
jgi:thiol-disulfide isomerase/thioredoxin